MKHFVETNLIVPDPCPIFTEGFSEGAGVDVEVGTGRVRIQVSGRAFDRLEDFLQGEGVPFTVHRFVPGFPDGWRQDATMAERRDAMMSVLVPSETAMTFAHQDQIPSATTD